MRLVITLGSLLLAAAPVAAMPFNSDSFVDARTGYRVEVSHSGDTMLLDGFKAQNHARFHLSVTRRGLVTGVYEGHKVNYVVGDKAADAVVATN